MPDLAHTDTVGWIALALLLIIVLAWWPLIREIPSTLAVLAQLVVERWQREDVEPLAFDPDGLAAATAELRAEREVRAARGLQHAARAKVTRDEMFGERAS